MKKLTIFTATYNREKKIMDTYISLINQTNKDFVWLVVDDGSTDNTRELFKKIIKDSRIEVQYFYKNNGGKHTAYNYGIDKVTTEYVYLFLDSDDILFSNDTVECILKSIENIEDEKMGLITLCTTDRSGKNNLNKFIKKYDVEKLSDKSLANAYRENLFSAECRMILKTNYVKKFKYPEIENENFFTEAYIYWQLEKPVNWTDINTCYSIYLADGLTANSINLFINNPNSWYLYNELRLENTKKIGLKLKYYVYFISFGLLSRNKIFKKNINILLVILLFPTSILGIIYLKIKGRKRN